MDLLVYAILLMTGYPAQPLTERGFGLCLTKLKGQYWNDHCERYDPQQEQLENELDGYRTEQKQYENDRKFTACFLKLVERYSSAEEMSTLVLNEFVEKIIVHERDRKGRQDAA